jgi:hypothetical protein
MTRPPLKPRHLRRIARRFHQEAGRNPRLGQPLTVTKLIAPERALGRPPRRGRGGGGGPLGGRRDPTRYTEPAYWNPAPLTYVGTSPSSWEAHHAARQVADVLFYVYAELGAAPPTTTDTLTN